MALQKCHSPNPPKTMCIVKILHKYLYGSAEVPQSSLFFQQGWQRSPQNHVHSKDTVQVSLWLCRSATVQNIFQQGWQRPPQNHVHSEDTVQVS